MIAAAAGGLTTGGILFMAAAWGGILGLTIFCFYRIFTGRGRRG